MRRALLVSRLRLFCRLDQTNTFSSNMQAATASRAAVAAPAANGVAALPPPSFAAAAAVARRSRALSSSGGGVRRPLSSLAASASASAAAAAAPEPATAAPKRRRSTKATSEVEAEAVAPPHARRTTTKKAAAAADEEEAVAVAAASAPDAAAPAAPAAAAPADKKKRAARRTASSSSTGGEAEPQGRQASAFYGPAAVGAGAAPPPATFASLGLHPSVCLGLERGPLSLARPSRVQALSVPALLAGGDVVLAAETGSGKTLAYLAPLMTTLLRRREARRDAAATAAAAAAAAATTPTATAAAAAASAAAIATPAGRRGRAEEGDMLLVLCPNGALCDQVVRAAHAVAAVGVAARGAGAAAPDADGAGGATPLLRAAVVSSARPPPFEAPDVAVATPSGLASLLRAAASAPGGPPYGALWTAAGLGRAVGAVVVDEADLLLAGGYSRDLGFLLDALKVAERRAAEARAARALGLPGGGRELAERLPGGARGRDVVRAALWSSGGDLAGWVREMARIEREGGCGDEEDGGRRRGGGGSRPSALSPAVAASADAADAAPASPRPSSSSPCVVSAATEELRRLLRLRDNDVDHRAAAALPPPPTAPRQHVFVAATMPALTKADAGTELERRYRRAAWVRGDLLHRALPGVSHSWVAIPGSSRGDGGGGGGEDDDLPTPEWERALARAVVEDDPAWAAGTARVLVFVRDAARAEAAAAVVRRAAAAAAAAAAPSVGRPSHSSAPFEVHSYHKGALAEARAAAMEAMRRPAPVAAAAAPPKKAAGKASAAAFAAGDAARAPPPPPLSVAVACTDAAARGVDLPRVTHVVQADFAGNASDFLHRVGRTARAGFEGGRVTSIYRGGSGGGSGSGEEAAAAEETGAEAVLAEALRAAIERGDPIEGAFSRNRSFSRKVKRYGTYVARGERG